MQYSTRKYELFFIFFIIFLAYTPLTGFLFSLKNDAFTGYFPPKYFLSETLDSQTLPLWNPYLNYGFPVFGDLNIGYWNPLTWLFAVLPGYNVYTFTIELILYLFFSGFSFYILGRHWQWSRPVKINASLSYACSGYFVAHLQHVNWISGMAFFPLVLLFYLRLNNKFATRDFLGFLLSAYLFCTAAHPGLVIGSIYFLGIIGCSAFIRISLSEKSQAIHFIKNHLLLVGCLLLILAGPIYAYLQVIPFTNRGEKLSMLRALSGPAVFKSWLTLLFPFSSTKNDEFWVSEISMRNCYTGLLTLIFFVKAIKHIYFKKYATWFSIFIFFILVSAGGFFGKAAATILPLIGLVRLSGEFTIFAIISIIIIAGFQFDAWSKNTADISWKKILNSLKLITVLTSLFSLIQIIYSKNSVFFYFNSGIDTGWRDFLKSAIDDISFFDCLLLQSLIQLILLVLLRNSLLKRPSALTWVLAVDLILATILNMPYTGVGKRSPSEIASLIEKQISESEVQSFTTIEASEKSNPEAEKIIGDLRWYQKSPGNLKRINYPLVLTSADSFFNSPRKQSYDNLPFIFADSGNSNNKLNILEFRPGRIIAGIELVEQGSITVQQMNFIGWEAIVNAKKVPIFENPEGLQELKLNPGKSEIIIQYRQPQIIFLLLYSVTILLLLSVLYVVNSRTVLNQSRSIHRSD